MDIKQTFDDEAKIYDFTSRAVNIYFDEALDTLVDNIKLHTKKPKILDICCGTGILTEKVAKKYPNAIFYGVDFSTGMLEIAKNRMNKYEFNILVSDICDERNMNNLPMFDLIISSFGVHNVHGFDNKQKSLNNILKHLKADGQYITCDLLKGSNKNEQKEWGNFQKQWLMKTYTEKEANNWIKLLDEEDDPETLVDNFRLLQNAGSKSVKLLWQKEFLAIWEAFK